MVRKKNAPKAVRAKTELTELEKFYIEQKCRDGVSLGEMKKVWSGGYDASVFRICRFKKTNQQES